MFAAASRPNLPPMSTETTRATVKAFYAALTKGDRDAVRGLLSDDCGWLPPASAPFEPMNGGAEIAAELGGRVVKRTFDISKPFNLEVRRIIADDDVAVVQQRLTATAKATGLPYDNQYCWVYTVRDGKIVHMEEYADTLLASRVMSW
jgi:ketosteroid isomerase-like protein